MLGIRLELAPAGGHGNAVPDSRQDILQRAPSRSVVKDFIGRDEGKTISLRSLAQPRLLRDFVFSPMTSHHAIKPVAKGVMEISGNFIRRDLPHN